MNLKDFYDLGKELLQGENVPEVKIRTSIGRIYNYVFHYVRENCRKHPDSKFRNGKGDHQEAVKFLERIEERRLASTLLSLTEQRNNAEYDLKLSFTIQKAKDYIDDADDFINRFNNRNIIKRRAKQKKLKRGEFKC